MNLKSARVIFPLLLLAILAGLTKACGSRVRSADFNISRNDVDTQLQNLYSALKTSSSGDSDLASLETFLKMSQDANSSIYYSETGTSLGQIDTVMPVFWQDLLFNQSTISGSVTKAWAYLVTLPSSDGGWRGGLVVAISESGAQQQQQQQPTPGASPSPNTSSGTSPTAVMVFLNDGNAVLPNSQGPVAPGTLSDTEFTMEVARRRDVALTLRSYDVYDGDLTDVIQVELWDSRFSDQNFTGLINFVQPN